MKIVIDIPNGYKDLLPEIQNGSIACSQVLKAVKNGKPYEQEPQGDKIEEVINELESRKDYGEEYGQAMEDAIVGLKAMLGINKGEENE